MAQRITREEFETSQGRKRAWRALMLGDHGALRLIYDNTHAVAPGKLWRSYQPSPARLKKWRDKGVQTVINLRGDAPSGFYFLEEEACRELGITLVSFRVYSREAPSIDTLKGAQELFESIEYPAMMHCKSGADRAGLMATLYRFFVDGAPMSEAMEQLSFRYGHIRQGKTGVIDYALEKFIDYAEREGKDQASPEALFDWAETEYDPKAVKQEFMSAWWGNLLTERLLRRE